MKEFLKILKRYASPYKRYLAWAVLLNIFSAVFNIFSFTLIIPILQILFGLDTTIYQFIPWESDIPMKDLVMNNMYYYVTLAINTFGGSKTLMLLGLFMDFLKEKLQLGDYAYRYIYAWTLFFNIIGIFCYLMMYREFLRLGGYTGYKAPAPWAPGGLEPMPVTEFSNPHKLAIGLSVYSMICSMGVLLLWSVFMYFTARNQQAAAAANHYLLRCLPLAAVLLAGYYAMGNMALKAGKLPHHGMLVLSAIMTVLLTISFAVENFLAFRMSKGTLAPNMLFYELITMAILLAMLFFYLALERKSNKATA